jgi:hypothetical protein
LVLSGDLRVDVVHPVDCHREPQEEDLVDVLDLLDPEGLVEKFNVEVQYLFVLSLELQVLLQTSCVLAILGQGELIVQTVDLLLPPHYKLVQNWTQTFYHIRAFLREFRIQEQADIVDQPQRKVQTHWQKFDVLK